MHAVVNNTVKRRRNTPREYLNSFVKANLKDLLLLALGVFFRAVEGLFKEFFLCTFLLAIQENIISIYETQKYKKAVITDSFFMKYIE